MLLDDRLTTADVSTIFAEEIAAAGGTVTDSFHDGSRLFARSVLPWIRQVRAKDEVQSGVALRATGLEVSVHPYVFRQVCSNGAIMAQAIQTRHVDGFDSLPFRYEDQAWPCAARCRLARWKKPLTPPPGKCGRRSTQKWIWHSSCCQCFRVCRWPSAARSCATSWADSCGAETGRSSVS